jgi:hypothetical protein
MVGFFKHWAVNEEYYFLGCNILQKFTTFPEILVNFCQVKECHIPKDSKFS